MSERERRLWRAGGVVLVLGVIGCVTLWLTAPGVIAVALVVMMIISVPVAVGCGLAMWFVPWGWGFVAFVISTAMALGAAGLYQWLFGWDTGP